MTMLRALSLGFGALLGVLSAASAQDPAQNYPNQAVRIVVPFSAGSATDSLARSLADKLAERWGQQVIVENRPGAAGTNMVAKANADGYTLMVTSNGHTVAGILNKNLPFDPLKDFAGVTQLASVPLVLIVNKDLPVNNVKELIALAKAKPGQINFPSPGLGSTTYIAGALFKQNANINIMHVPYRGAPESVTSVIRGDTQFYFSPVNVTTELMQAGQVRAIAVATPQRVPMLPDIPTMAEAGVPNYGYDSWFGLMVPANTPRAIIAKVNRDTVRAMQARDVQERFAKQGVVIAVNTPEQFDKIIKDDARRYAEVFKDAAAAN